MINKRLIPLLIPLALLLSNELFLLYPKSVFVALFLGIAFILLGARIMKSGSKNNKSWLLLSILPILLYVSLSLYAALLSNRFAIQIVMLFLAGMTFYYFKNIYYYLVSEDESRINKLESFSATAGFLIIFTSFASIYILPLFIRLDVNIMLLFTLPLSFFLFLQPVLFSRAKLKGNLALILTNTLILAQLAWLFSWLPLNYNVLGLLAALTYYLILIVTRLSLKGDLNRRSLKWPVLLVVIASLSLLLSARWL